MYPMTTSKQPGAVVHYERTGRVAVLRLDGPPANALTTGLVEQLDIALDRAVDDGVSVVVVGSAVPGFFVAGADIKLLESGDGAVFGAYLRRLRRTIERFAESPFLSVAAIGGHALGGGLELAMACTLRVAGDLARLGVPEVKLGLLPGAGGTQRLPRLVGRTVALELTLSGRSMTGAEAADRGLVDRLVEDALGEAEEWAHELAQGPVTAYREIVRCIDASESDRDLGMGIELDAVTMLFETDDGREGLRAFLEKRRPVFGSRDNSADDQ